MTNIEVFIIIIIIIRYLIHSSKYIKNSNSRDVMTLGLSSCTITWLDP